MEGIKTDLTAGAYECPSLTVLQQENLSCICGSFDASYEDVNTIDDFEW